MAVTMVTKVKLLTDAMPWARGRPERRMGTNLARAAVGRRQKTAVVLPAATTSYRYEGCALLWALSNGWTEDL